MEKATTYAPRLYTADTLTGRDVISTTGEHLGEIESIVIDSSRGCIAYAVLGMRGGTFGKEKLFAVPWQTLMMDEAHKDFVMDVDPEILKNSPGFDRDNWPQQSDPTFARQVNEYYGYDEDYKYRGGGTSGYTPSRSYGTESEGKGWTERTGEKMGIDPDRDKGMPNR